GGGPERAQPAPHRILVLRDQAVGGDLRVRQDLLEAVHAAGGDVVPLEERDPVLARAAAEDLAQGTDHLFAVLDARRVGGEARIGEQVVASEGGAQPLVERVGEAGDDEVAVARREGLVGHEIGWPPPDFREAGPSGGALGGVAGGGGTTGAAHATAA